MVGFPKSVHKYIYNTLGIDILRGQQQNVKPRVSFRDFELKYLTYKQYEVLKDIEKNNYKKVIFNGAIGSGKTFLACYFMVKNLIQNRHLYKENMNNCIFGSSIDMINTITLRELSSVCKLLNIPFEDKQTNNTHCFVDGLKLKLYGGVDMSRFGKFRGSNTALVYVNEATVMHKDTLAEIMNRLRAGQQTIIFDTNPSHPLHYFKTDYVDRTAIYKTYNFTIYDNPHLPKEYVEMQERIGQENPVHKARNLLGQWVASNDTIFSSIVQIPAKDYTFTQSIMYIDPAFSIGGDNTAVCVLEESGGVLYAFIYQIKKPITDLTVLSAISVIVENYAVRTVYVEDRDSIKGTGSVTRQLGALRDNMSYKFRIKPVKPKSNKENRIASLLVPMATDKLKIFDNSSVSAFNDMYIYTGDGKTNDDALDALSGAYLLLNPISREAKTNFVIGNYFI